MKRRFIFFVIPCLLLFTSVARQPEAAGFSRLGVKRVVIDAGHGGHDPGAVGKKFKESSITLSIALKLGQMIQQEFPEVEVIYTRKTDVFVELHKRAHIANEAKADLFISLHCNASKSTSATGTETWVMGLHKSEANLEVARLENATILLEDDYGARYDGFDPNSPEAYIIFSLFQNLYLDQSLNLAAQIQKQFTNRLGRVNRGVKQAGFLVLYKTTMPGVLIEAGFISNAEEEIYLGSDHGQQQLAKAIFAAFKTYKTGIEDVIIPEDTDEALVSPPDTARVVQKDPPVVKDTLQQSGIISFRVQFTTSPKEKDLRDPVFSGLKDVKSYYHSGLYKYTAGIFSIMDEAVRYQGEVRQKGFKDAFVVAFLDEKRISTAEAEQILKNQKK